MASGTKLASILEALRNTLIARVINLSEANCDISRDGSGRIEGLFRMSDYGCAIFYQSRVPEGYAGGLEMKELQVILSFVHTREVDEREVDRARIRSLFEQLAEQAFNALQGVNFAGDAELDEPMEFLREDLAPMETEKLIRVNQLWRCMHNDFLKDRLASHPNIPIGP